MYIPHTEMQKIRQHIECAQKELHRCTALLCSTNTKAKYKVGQRIIRGVTDVVEITRIVPGRRDGDIHYFGRAVLKSGRLHTKEKHLWSYAPGRRLRSTATEYP